MFHISTFFYFFRCQCHSCFPLIGIIIGINNGSPFQTCRVQMQGLHNNLIMKIRVKDVDDLVVFG